MGDIQVHYVHYLTSVAIQIQSAPIDRQGTCTPAVERFVLQLENSTSRCTRSTERLTRKQLASLIHVEEVLMK